MPVVLYQLLLSQPQHCYHSDISANNSALASASALAPQSTAQLLLDLALVPQHKGKAEKKGQAEPDTAPSIERHCPEKGENKSLFQGQDA